MALLEPILRTCKAERYIDNFREFGIEPYVFKILGHEDLSAIGIEDENLRTDILNHFANLQIPTEKKQEIKIDLEYTLIVLHLMSVHLNKHFEILSNILKQDEVDLCHIRNGGAVRCLESSLHSLEAKILALESKMLTPYDNTISKMRKTFLVVSTFGITMLVLFGCVKFLR
ncbi:uncharacterized protein LOC132701666 [Cylas formicarius]|uniref:uncharacterized protein LOC132701666 n=1 Tax=Cylas formicarius TaxID=197179 RepID=UPI00295848A5|nr:uncharacterized protein LOC132701666 [Cylas formicarius]